jgi:hypothetical protein
LTSTDRPRQRWLIESCEALRRRRLQQGCVVKKVLTLLHHLS